MQWHFHMKNFINILSERKDQLKELVFSENNNDITSTAEVAVVALNSLVTAGRIQVPVPCNAFFC